MSRGLRLTLGLVFAVFLMALLIRLTGEDVPRLLALDPLWLLAGAGFYGVCFLSRGLRMAWMESEERRARVGTGGVMSITGVHTAANQILPFRLGELTYATIMHQKTGSGLGQGLATTVRMRLADLMGLALVTVICVLGAGSLGGTTLGILLAISAAVALFSGWLLFYGARWAGPWLKRRGDRPATRWGRLVGSFADGLMSGDHDAAGRWKVFVSSLCLWMGIILVHWALGKALGLGLTPWSMGVVALGSILLTYLPLSAFGNFGLSEGGFVLGFSLLEPELPAHRALELGMNIHVGLLMIVILYGVLSGVHVRGIPREDRDKKIA